MKDIKILVADNILVKGLEVKEPILEGFKSPYDAFLIKCLKDEGLSINENINIKDIKKDTFNDIDILISLSNPLLDGIVSNNNLINLRTTYGRISRYGLIGDASSIDSISIIGKDIKLILKVLMIITKKDKRDLTNHEVKELSDEEKISIKENANFIYSDYLKNIYDVISSVEFSSEASRYDGIRYGKQGELKELRTKAFSNKQKERIIYGTHILMDDKNYYSKALKLRRDLVNEFKELLNKNNILIFDYNENTRYLGYLLGMPMVIKNNNVVISDYFKEELILKYLKEGKDV